MTEEEILDAVVIGASRDLASVVCWLTLSPVKWCVIGDRATDSYAPPAIYTARLDVAGDQKPGLALLSDLTAEGFRVQVDDRAQVVSLIRPGDGHRLRVVIHFNPRFRSMPRRADRRAILGREMPVAALPDVVAALLWQRAKPGQPERQQAEAEMHLFRLAESHAEAVDDLLPADLLARAERDRERVMAYPDGDGWGEPFTL